MIDSNSLIIIDYKDKSQIQNKQIYDNFIKFSIQKESQIKQLQSLLDKTKNNYQLLFEQFLNYKKTIENLLQSCLTNPQEINNHELNQKKNELFKFEKENLFLQEQLNNLKKQLNITNLELKNEKEQSNATKEQLNDVIKKLNFATEQLKYEKEQSNATKEQLINSELQINKLFLELKTNQDNQIKTEKIIEQIKSENQNNEQVWKSKILSLQQKLEFMQKQQKSDSFSYRIKEDKNNGVIEHLQNIAKIIIEKLNYINNQYQAEIQQLEFRKKYAQDLLNLFHQYLRTPLLQNEFTFRHDFKDNRIRSD
ncbi:unnamed protein product [Paramecium sonneborni]|uniref:Uncharacterized protein n=1 Tax=Paramecium sonneborni TaxID=65129 RepID=A0A8S1KJW7_9CILI|nr:unnamed protein product [Paramecium sonneborni]